MTVVDLSGGGGISGVCKSTGGFLSGGLQFGVWDYLRHSGLGLVFSLAIGFMVCKVNSWTTVTENAQNLPQGLKCMLIQGDTHEDKSGI